MSSQPLTFPCPFCGRRMGVAAEWAGKRVRCPHCKQVVQAPPAAEAAAPPPPPPPPPAPPPPPEPVVPDPVFNLPAKEAADSILSDPAESEDDVFGSHEGGRVPVLPPVDVTPDEPLPTAPVGHSPPLILNPVDRTLPPPAGGNPFAFESTPAPVLTPASPPPARVPPPAPPPPRPRPAPPPPDEEPVAVEELPDDYEDPPPRRPERRERSERPERVARPAAAGGERRGPPAAVVYGLAAWALLATGLAVYGLFFRPPEVPPGHPLSTIPDTYGEFNPASRKGEKGKAEANRVKGDGELPAELRAGIGGKVELGHVEVEPVGVERRPLNLFTDGKDGGPATPVGRTATAALVLRLRVKNTSPDLSFCPLDPAFNRKTVSRATDRPLTRLVVGADTYYGGPVTWPFPGRRQFEKEQEADDAPLGPGESREYVVCSPPDQTLIAAVRGAKGPVQWRVQVRRGTILFREKEVPVTAVIGVDFRKDEVAGLGGG